MRQSHWILLIVSALCMQCKTHSSSLMSESVKNDSSNQNKTLYLASPPALSCQGSTVWNRDLINKFVINDELSLEDYAMQRSALKKSLSSLPPFIGLEFLAHNVSIHLVKDAYEHCSLKKYNIKPGRPTSFCVSETPDSYTIYLSSYENEIPSIKSANTDIVFALMIAYISRVMSVQIWKNDFLPRMEDRIAVYSQVIQNNYFKFKALGSTFPIESQESVFTLLAYMSYCSDQTQADLKKLIPTAQSDVQSLFIQIFQDDSKNSPVLANLASQFGYIKKQDLNGLGLVVPWAELIAEKYASFFGAGKTRILAEDQARFLSSQARLRNAIHSELPEAERARAIEILDSAYLPNPLDPALYREGLDSIRESAVFKKIYNAVFHDEHSKCFIQVPQAHLTSFATSVTHETRRITLTVHGTFDASAPKIGGSWSDPLGDTAQTYAKFTHNLDLSSRVDSKADYLGAFRWKAANTDKDRQEAAVSLVDSLLQMMQEVEQHNESLAHLADPLEISLVGHSHGGNVIYQAMKHLEERVASDDPVAARMLGYIKEEKIKLRILTIASPIREYVPPRWGQTIHISANNDGVAYLGQADGAASQLGFYTLGWFQEAPSAEFYRRLGEENSKIKLINLPTYGIDPGNVFGPNHINSVDALGAILYEIEHFNLQDKPLDAKDWVILDDVKSGG